MTSFDLIESHLEDPEWRLNNLYTIIDKEGRSHVFRFNWVQEKLYNDFWYLNVVLKARQLGISTFVCLFFLDKCLFNPNISAGIIAHTREDAEHMFKRIKFAYDQLPDCIKSVRSATVDSARELVFNNHSSLRVGTSMRGSTLQYLHISEFGKICAHFPDKAREIITGSLNTIGSRQHIFIESTAEGKEGYFYDICKQAEALQVAKKELTSLDYRFHFYPWYECSDYILNENVPITKEMNEYFTSLLHQGIELSQNQKNWYLKKLLTQKDDMKREYPSTPDESFESAIDGSFYAKWIREARFEGRVGSVPWDRDARVSVAFDPGYLDSCAVVWFQCIGQEIHIIDYYENSKEGLTHYLGIIKSKPYVYEHYYGPHDIESHQFSTGLSTKEVGASLGIQFITLKTLKLRLEDGIEAVRSLFPRFWIDEKNCSRLIKCIENYRKEFDLNYQVYKNKPLHDQYSHGCFPSGTKISTSSGEKLIEDILIGDSVITPFGEKKVLKTFEYESDEFILVETANYKFTCTPNHKIFTDRGLICADALRYNDVLYSIKNGYLWNENGTNLKASNTGFRESFLSAMTRSTSCFVGTNSDGTDATIADIRRESDICTKQCGGFFVEKSLNDGTFITKMGTLGTIRSKILNLLVQANIPGCICKIQKGAKQLVGTFIKPWNMLKNGMGAQKEGNGIENMRQPSTLERKLTQCVHAPYASKNINQSNHGASFVLMPANPSSGIEAGSMRNRGCAKFAGKNFDATNITESERVVWVARETCKAKQKVYDFHVEGDHCYYANGILVSNSDALRYAAIAIKTYVDSSKSGISEAEADRMYDKYHPVFT